VAWRLPPCPNVKFFKATGTISPPYNKKQDALASFWPGELQERNGNVTGYEGFESLATLIHMEVEA